jgi:predicted KAP-like P-loop ATPase
MIENSDIFKQAPIDSLEEDEFGRDIFVKSLVNFIKSQSTNVNKLNSSEYRGIQDTFVIGLHGSWGAGKSSIIRCSQKLLEKNPNAIFTLTFNPWMYKSEEILIIDLFKELTSVVGLAKDKKIKENLARLLSKYAFCISHLNQTVGNFAENFAGLLKDENTTQIYKEKINEILGNLSNPITIFVDDIDRLDKREIQTLFKTIRLIADFKNVIYVLAFDDEMVAKSISDLYESGSKEDGKAFLEKIIHIPLKIPEISKDELLLFSLELLNIDEESAPEEFISNFDFLHNQTFHTPRDSKRFANTIKFYWASLNSKIDYYDLVLIEVIRIKLPALFKMISQYYQLHELDLKSPRTIHDSNEFQNHLMVAFPSLRKSTGVDKNHPIYGNVIRLFSDLLSVDLSSSDLGLTKNTTPANRGYKNVATTLTADDISRNRIKNPSVLKNYFEFSTALEGSYTIVED